MKTRFLILIVLAFAPLAFAQDVIVPEHATVVTNAPYFLVAALAGLVLALAFQLVLTTLSLATGLQAIGSDWEDAYTDTDEYGADYGRMSEANTGTSHAGEKVTDRIGRKARTISSAFGIWSIITASIALFFASWLATELSLTADLTAGAVLGLVIWGLFYIVLMRWEMGALHTIMNRLNQYARTGMRAARKATRATVHGAQSATESDLASNITTRVREEIFGDSEVSQLREQLRTYMRECPTPPQLNREAVKQDFRRMLHDPRAGADSLIRRLKSIDRETLRDCIASRPDVSPEEAERMLDDMEQTRDETIARAQQMKEEVARRMDAAKREAIHVADEVRKTAATASWWAFGTAVVSGAAAALGGMVAVITGPWGG
jgi:ABC-type multidrug transport system fused ATPase/permease subunit